MKNIITLSMLIILTFLATSAHAWLIYSKPEFRGRIIDAETKQPIEGVVVVVVYKDHTIVGGPGGGGTSVIKAKETLTDKKGEFYFSAYTTLMGPNSREHYVDFIIFKPGYSYGSPALNLYTREKFFATDIIGKEGEILDDSILSGKTWKGVLGIVEMKKAKTREEKWKAPMFSTSGLKSKNLPILYKAIDEAEKNLRMEGIR